MSKTAEEMDIIQRANKVFPQVVYRLTQIVADHGKGSYLYDVNGDRYLDFSTGIAVNCLGHSNDRVNKAVKEQIDKITHAMINVVYNDVRVKAAERLLDMVPRGFDQVFFSNSGAEAIEGALKLAEYYSKKKAFIAFQGGFHGRTKGALSITSSKANYVKGYSRISDVIFAPYAYCYRCPFGLDYPACEIQCVKYLEGILKQVIHPDDVAGLVIEPIQGEGGYIVPPKEFLQKVDTICKENNILLIVDEVQTGVGRTGKFFAYEHYGITPDIVTMAKSIAGGLPLSAIISKKDITACWEPGAHAGTFGGNLLSCAALIEVLNAIEEQDLINNAREMGDYFMKKLKNLKQEYSMIGDVRGSGLMIGLEFIDTDRNPASEYTKKLNKILIRNGLLVPTAGPYGNVIRFIPPLNVKREELDESLDILTKSLAQL